MVRTVPVARVGPLDSVGYTEDDHSKHRQLNKRLYWSSRVLQCHVSCFRDVSGKPFQARELAWLASPKEFIETTVVGATRRTEGKLPGRSATFFVCAGRIWTHLDPTLDYGQGAPAQTRHASMLPRNRPYRSRLLRRSPKSIKRSTEHLSSSVTAPQPSSPSILSSSWFSHSFAQNLIAPWTHSRTHCATFEISSATFCAWTRTTRRKMTPGLLPRRLWVICWRPMKLPKQRTTHWKLTDASKPTARRNEHHTKAI